jgi:peroxiredoxin Q/BCP
VSRKPTLLALTALALVVLCLAVALFLGVDLAESAWNTSQPDTPAVQVLVCGARSTGPSLEAREYLQSQQVHALSGSLEEYLANAAAFHVPSQFHPLLGQAAPPFELPDSSRQPWKLRGALERGPVVLVFYYGYHCNHCVGQLLALHDDIDRFRELAATVVAVSADPPETTLERFRRYGLFAFPVLSDPGSRIAQRYGVFHPARAGKPELLMHGTFVIGRDGRIVWSHRGDEPFTDNRTLLYEIARVEGRLPAR